MATREGKTDGNTEGTAGREAASDADASAGSPDSAAELDETAATAEEEMLGALVRLDAEAAQAYLAGAEAFPPGDARDTIQGFAADHLNHVEVLVARLDQLGVTGVESSLEEMPLLLAALARMAAPLGPHAIVLALLSNEQLTNLGYEDALAYEWDDETEDILERHRADEERHFAWLAAKHDELAKQEGEEEAQPGAPA